MKYDCIIIGGGLAGLFCGITLQEAGLDCAIIAKGMSALHFSSGSIDLLGSRPPGEVVRSPFEALPRFIAQHPHHPYARCGPETVARALAGFTDQVAQEGLTLYANGARNHFHVTALGTLRPTYLSPASVFSPGMQQAFAAPARKAATILSVEGFRDFHPQLAAANLRRHPLFRDWDITAGSIRMPGLSRSPREFRSIDLARIFDTRRPLDPIAAGIDRIAGRAELVGMPAFLGIDHHPEVIKALTDLTGRRIYEIPTLPPSILGMRLDTVLKSRFARLGGVLVTGDAVVGGKFQHGRLLHLYTRHNGSAGLAAPYFVLATGSFFSGGLASTAGGVEEPLFGLALDGAPDRSRWYAPRFLAPEGHPFLTFGVRTDPLLRPALAGGQRVENLFCAGAVLSGYDPVREGSGGGVALSTGYLAAQRIIAAGRG